MVGWLVDSSWWTLLLSSAQPGQGFPCQWWPFYWVIITIKEVRLWLFVALCCSCHLITGHGRILSAAFKEGGVPARSPAALWRFCFRTQTSFPMTVETAGSEWQNLHHQKTLTHTRKYHICERCERIYTQSAAVPLILTTVAHDSSFMIYLKLLNHRHSLDYDLTWWRSSSKCSRMLSSWQQIDIWQKPDRCDFSPDVVNDS